MNQSIVVTGGAGFLGQVVVRKLKERGYTNVGVPRQTGFDLTKESDVILLYEKMKPDVVIHLAAVVGGIGANMAKPGEFFYKNLIMGVQLLEHARLKKIKKFVTVGTICAYPKHTPVPFKEENLWDGYPEETNAPYGIAKKALLVQSQSYRQQYKFNGIYLLPVNLYGPGDNFDLETSHVIPAMIRKFYEAKDQRKKEVVLWGTGKASREFIYVDDAAEGIVLATEKYDGADPVNVGTGREITIKDLAQKIKKILGFEGTIVWDSTKPDGQPRRALDTSKAESLFGFKAAMSFDDGLKKTVDWYAASQLSGKRIVA